MEQPRETAGGVAIGTLRLNLGSGPRKLPGFRSVDRIYGQECFPLTYADGSVDFALASHLLEHFSWRTCQQVLFDWVRVLKDGATIQIAVPDFDLLIDQHRQGVPIIPFLFGGQTDESDYHCMAFDEPTLRALMEFAGLKNIRRWVSDYGDCSSLPISLNLEGEKDAEQWKDIPPCRPRGTSKRWRPPNLGKQITAVLSAPRIGFLDNALISGHHLASLGLRVEWGHGVNWARALTDLMEAAIKRGTPYILTQDYDSLFTSRDVWELWRVIEAAPEVSAVCAVQSRREMDRPLFTTGSVGGVEAEKRITHEDLGGDTYPIATGHFGLTLLRTEKVAALPRPWFNDEPDADGRWEAGRIDADIWFWKRWAEAGNVLCLAPRVVVGHIEQVATFPDVTMRGRHQRISEYARVGKPYWVWQ